MTPVMLREANLVRNVADHLVALGYREDQLIVEWTYTRDQVFDLAIINPDTHKALAVFIFCPNKNVDTITDTVVRMSRLDNKFQTAIYLVFPSRKTRFEVFQLSLIDGISDLKRINQFPDYESLDYRVKAKAMDDINLELADLGIREFVQKEVAPEVGPEPIEVETVSTLLDPSRPSVSEFETDHKEDVAAAAKEEIAAAPKIKAEEQAPSQLAQELKQTERDLDNIIRPTNRIQADPADLLVQTQPARNRIEPERIEIKQEANMVLEQISQDKFNKLLVYLYRKERYRKLLKSRNDLVNLGVGAVVILLFVLSMFNVLRISTGTAILMAASAYFVQQYLLAYFNKD